MNTEETIQPKIGNVYYLKDFTAPKIFMGDFYECALTDQKVAVGTKIKKDLGSLKDWPHEIWKKDRFKNLINYKGRGEVLSEVFGTESLIDLIQEVQVLMSTGRELATMSLFRKAMQLYAEEYAKGKGLGIRSIQSEGPSESECGEARHEVQPPEDQTISPLTLEKEGWEKAFIDEEAWDMGYKKGLILVRFQFGKFRIVSLGGMFSPKGVSTMTDLRTLDRLVNGK
jgi:hypothetical protein